KPWKRPTHPLLESFDLGQRRARYCRESGVSRGQVDVPAAEAVSKMRAIGASLLPIRLEHKVVDDELPETAEQPEQVQLAARPFKNVLLFDLDHRELAAFSVKRVPLVRKRFFFSQQLFSRILPLVARNN